MKKTLSVLCLAALASLNAEAQGKKSNPNTTPPAQAKADKTKPAKAEDGGYSMSPNGMEYKIVYDAQGTQKPVIGDYISAHLLSTVDDSVLFSTRAVLNNMPAEVQMMQPPGKGDIMEGFTYMTVGDSAVLRFSVDSLMKMPGIQPLPWMKSGVGQKIYYFVVLAGVKSAADKQKEMEAATAVQKQTDDKLLQEYFAKNNIKATKTESGLYYTISKMGNGAIANIGDTVVVNYTGTNLDGRKFDSNVDSAFGHPGQPFEFPVGMRRVIAGWDEGFRLIKKGSKATLYIPSGLAYGANTPDPNRIPANGILMFDVELVNIKSQAGASDGKTTPAPKKK
jgi:FKBP-type peptidyl-prolyl cis-trans isomerase